MSVFLFFPLSPVYLFNPGPNIHEKHLRKPKDYLALFQKLGVAAIVRLEFLKSQPAITVETVTVEPVKMTTDLTF